MWHQNYNDRYLSEPGDTCYEWEDGIGPIEIITRQGNENMRRKRRRDQAAEFNRIKRGLPRGR